MCMIQILKFKIVILNEITLSHFQIDVIPYQTLQCASFSCLIIILSDFYEMNGWRDQGTKTLLKIAVFFTLLLRLNKGLDFLILDFS